MLLHIDYLEGKNQGVKVPRSDVKIEGFLKGKRCFLKKKGGNLDWRRGPGGGEKVVEIK